MIWLKLKIINGILPLEFEICCQNKFQILTNWIFFANKIIHFWNKLPNYVNSNSVKNSRLNWVISEKMVRKRISKGIFGNNWMNYWREFHLFINIVFVLSKDSCFYSLKIDARRKGPLLINLILTGCHIHLAQLSE